jgi:hypothetical protein
MRRPLKLALEVIIITILFVVISLVYSGQKRISFNDGKGWDGMVYFEMSRQFQQGESHVEGKLPFIKRIGTPYLIGVFSRHTRIDLLNSALIVNLIGIFITVLLLLFWLRIFIDVSWIRVLLLFLFMMAWHVPLRSSFYHPEGTDTWGSLWLLAGLLILQSIRDSYLKTKKLSFLGFVSFSLIIALGYSFRETNAVMALFPIFIFKPIDDLKINSKTMTVSHGIEIIKKTWKLYFVRQSLLFTLPFIAIILAKVLIMNIIRINDQDDYSFFIAACSTFYTKSLPEYLLGIFNAFGPLIILVPFYWKQFRSLLIERQELLILLIYSLFIGYTGAGGTERITFMSGFPIILIMIGISIRSIFNSPQRWWLFVLIALQTIAFRFYWYLPDYPNTTKNVPIPFMTLIGSDFQVLDLYSSYGSILINIFLFLEYCFLFFLTMYVLFSKIDLKSLSRRKFA